MATTTSEIGTFGALLRQHRLAASLSQEVLGERAQFSVNAIAALERGRRSAPRPGTVVLLADALKLPPAERAALIGAAAGARLGGLAKPDGRTGPLPVSLTSFIGRESDLAEVRRLLGFTRMLTLTGAGGIGKTRLAIEAGRSTADVAFVDLAPYSDGRLVSMAIAAALGVHEQSRIPLLDLLTATLASRRLLLLLDNCEHVIQACAALVDALLRGCPDLSVLATSREALRITGEVTWRVPPLSVPDPMLRSSAEAVARCEAVRLFVERAKAALPGFALTERTAPGIVEVCRRLEGIPLAIELAAARVRVLGVDQITARLDDHLRLLRGGSRSAVPRQQTLRATIDWSYELLTGPERRLFDRLSVFAGGLSLEAAEAVCGADGVAEDEVVDVLAGLVNKSLVIADPGDYRVARYTVLETLRQYGAERLTASGGAPTIQERHALFYVTLAHATEPGLFGPEQLANMIRLELERGNLRVALQWAVESGNAEVGLRLCAAVFKFWEVSGSVSEGRVWLTRLLAHPASTRTRARARALAAAVHLATLQGDVASARVHAEESLAIARELGDGTRHSRGAAARRPACDLPR